MVPFHIGPIILASKRFIDSDLPKNPTVGDYFDFSKSTHIESAISNLNVYSQYSSEELYFTQKHGDIALDKSINGYEKLQVKASNGKILTHLTQK